MKASRKGLRLALLLGTGAVLLVSFAAFAILLIAYHRGDDANNEDTLKASARAAYQEGNYPYATELYRRLIALNPFEKGYQDAYLHALVGLRDFETLATATNNTPTFSLTKDERAVEAAILRGVSLIEAGSNEQSVATLVGVTNLNYFAVTPFLIQVYTKAERPDLAMGLIREYLRRFPHSYLIQQEAEWAALAHRQDLLDECRTHSLAFRGRRGIALAHYCDALTAWISGDEKTLIEAMTTLNGEIQSPLARFLALECAASGDNAEAVEKALDDLVQNEPPDSPLVGNARAVVKRFLGAHFPDRITLEHIQRLTTLIYDEKNPDVDILRLSLLARACQGVLLPSELDNALRLFPNDRGLAVIRKQQSSRR